MFFDICLIFFFGILCSFSFKLEKLSNTYFAFSQLLYRNEITPCHLIIRALIPLLYGAIAALLATNKILVAGSSCFLGSFLVIWPMIFDISLFPTRGYRALNLFLLYLCFILGSTALGVLAGSLVVLIYNTNSTDMHSIKIGIITAFIGYIITLPLVFIFKSKSKHN